MHHKDRTDRPKTFPILSPLALSLDFDLLLAEDVEREISGMGKEEGRVNQSGSVEIRGMKVKVRDRREDAS